MQAVGYTDKNKGIKAITLHRMVSEAPSQLPQCLRHMFLLSFLQWHRFDSSHWWPGFSFLRLLWSRQTCQRWSTHSGSRCKSDWLCFGRAEKVNVDSDYAATFTYMFEYNLTQILRFSLRPTFSSRSRSRSHRKDTNLEKEGRLAGARAQHLCIIPYLQKNIHNTTDLIKAKIIFKSPE